MSILSRIIQELRTPDDQSDNWYAWASNQMAHAFLGVLVAVYFKTYAVEVALLVSVLKESLDLSKRFDKDSVIDSLFDISFWILGAFLVSSGQRELVTLCMLFLLVCGVIVRSRTVRDK